MGHTLTPLSLSPRWLQANGGLDNPLLVEASSPVETYTPRKKRADCSVRSCSSDAPGTCRLEELQKVSPKLCSLDFSGEKKKKKRRKKKGIFDGVGPVFPCVSRGYPLPPSMAMSIADCRGPTSTLAIPFAEGRTV